VSNTQAKSDGITTILWPKVARKLAGNIDLSQKNLAKEWL